MIVGTKAGEGHGYLKSVLWWAGMLMSKFIQSLSNNNDGGGSGNWRIL